MRGVTHASAKRSAIAQIGLFSNIRRDAVLAAAPATPQSLAQQRIVEMDRHTAKAANEPGIAVRLAALLDEVEVVAAAIVVGKRLRWLVPALDTTRRVSRGCAQAHAPRSDRASNVPQLAVFPKTSTSVFAQVLVIRLDARP